MNHPIRLLLIALAVAIVMPSAAIYHGYRNLNLAARYWWFNMLLEWDSVTRLWGRDE